MVIICAQLFEKSHNEYKNYRLDTKDPYAFELLALNININF